VTENRLATFAALKGRNYCLYWFGLVFYVLGHRAEYMTFAWITWELSRDPLALGYLGLAQGVPLVLFQLFGGVLADRMDRLRLLLVTQVLTSLILAVAFAMTVFGSIRIEHLLVLAALSNTFRAFDEPSRMALIPQLVERDDLPNAIALGAIPWQAGRMIGPSVTGILIAAFGGAIGFGMAAASSFIALALYSRLRVHAGRRAHDGQHVLRQFVEGLSFVGHHFVFAGLIGLALFNSLFAMSYLTLLPIFADAYFGAGSTGYGLLNAAHGTGALMGSLTIATLAHLILRRGTALLVAAACLGCFLIVFSRSEAMGGPARAGARRLQQHLLSDAGQHLPPAAGARPPSRAGHEPVFPLLEPAATRRPAGRRAGRRCGRALRRAVRRRHGGRERARAAHVEKAPLHRPGQPR